VIDRAREEGARLRREREWIECSGSDGESATDDGGTLSKLLADMEPDDREVIVLAKFLEFPASRVAEILDISTGAARVRLHRALRRLMERYRTMGAA
jgi:RNA polymerase sigma-70 factor (ECF subfamily)